MSTVRVAGPAVSSIFRFTSKSATSNRCAHCLRAQRCPFSSYRPRLQSSKRPLMTESAYRPQSLEPEMPPPRNHSVPETSISSSVQEQTWPPKSLWSQSTLPGGVGLREGAAQQSRPVESPIPVPTSTSASKAPSTEAAATVKPRKSKLRPRKAPITLTPKAVEQLHTLFDQPEGKLIRVGVKNRGCSGLAYHLEYVDKAGAFDETVEQDGVKVLIDSKALFSIIGSEMDWLEDKLSARFIFKNPNITEQCGCGESFSIS